MARRRSCCSDAAACGSRRPTRPSARSSGSSPAPTICSRSSTPRSCGSARPTSSRRFRAESLVPRAVVPADLRRATEVFDEYLGRTLQIDLTDLSRDRWSLVPSAGDMIAEVRTRRFGSLTYARSGNEAEDITVFDRRRRRNISLYASAAKLAARGRFYSEDDLVDYDVLAYEVDAAFAPERYWINGTAHLRVRVRAGRDDDDDVEAGRGVRGPRRVCARLRPPAPPAGRQPEQPDRESADAGLPRQRVHADDRLQRPARAERARSRGGRLSTERSSRSASRHRSRSSRATSTATTRIWYPQSTVSDYALGTLRVTVPPEFDVVATGTLTGPPKPAQRGRRRRRSRAEDVRLSERPARPLPLVRHQPHDAGCLHADADPGVDGGLRRSPCRRARSVAARIRWRPPDRYRSPSPARRREPRARMKA